MKRIGEICVKVLVVGAIGIVVAFAVRGVVRALCNTLFKK